MCNTNCRSDFPSTIPQDLQRIEGIHFNLSAKRHVGSSEDVHKPSRQNSFAAAPI